jgi:hypothetical protein
MTRLLDEALSELSKLPDWEQDVVAKWLLEELAAEQRWQRLFADSKEKLSSLADDALSEHHRGRTQELDPDTL